MSLTAIAAEHCTPILHVRLGLILTMIGDVETLDFFSDAMLGVYRIQASVGRTLEVPAGQVVEFRFSPDSIPFCRADAAPRLVTTFDLERGFFRWCFQCR